MYSTSIFPNCHGEGSSILYIENSFKTNCYKMSSSLSTWFNYAKNNINWLIKPNIEMMKYNTKR